MELHQNTNLQLRMLTSMKMPVINYLYLGKNKQTHPVTSATRQVRQQWFLVCIFPLMLLFGLTGIEDQR
jgi:hypothetical protein